MDKRHDSCVHDVPDLKILPDDLRRELLQEARSENLCQHALFFALRVYRARWFSQIAYAALQHELQFPDEVRFIVGQNCCAMYFITNGNSIYVKRGQAFSDFLGMRGCSS